MFSATVAGMVTAEQYTSITGAEAPEFYETVRDEAVAILEGALGRRLVSAERTEVLPCYSDGVVYPTATPVTDCQDATFTATEIRTGRKSSATEVEVTYTGGYEEFGAEENGLPTALAHAIAWGVHTLLNPANEMTAPGVQSLSVGDYSVSFQAGYGLGADGAPVSQTMAAAAVLGGRACQLAAPYRRVR